MALVTTCAVTNIRGKAAKYVNMKPKGSGNFIVQETGKAIRKKIKEQIN